MSFGNSGAISVGTLAASFTLDANAATGAINNVLTSTNQIRDAFKNTYKLTVDNSTATKNVQNIDQSLKNTFKTVYQIKVDNRQAVQSINQTTSALDTFKKGLELVGGLAALDLVSKGFGALKDAIFNTNASIQQSQLKFEAFTGSVQTATTLMTQLENIASHSTFGLAAITEASGQLLAFQVNAKNVPALMSAIQNATAAAGGDMVSNFSNITRVVGELAGGLPLTERQVRQLVTAGVPLQPLAAQLGITVDQLLNVGKTGIVSGDQLVAAFAKVYNDGKLGDFMEKQAGTFNGAMALIKTNLQLASAQAFKPFFDEISGIAVKIGELVQTPTFQSWVDNISKAVSAATDVLRTFLGVLAPVAEGVAATFGINTGNLSKEMADAAKSKPTFSPYDPSLQGGSDTAKQSAADLAQQQVDALGNVKTAVASLDEAMGYPNGQKGIASVVADLGTLEQSASGETRSAIASVNDALALPEGSIGPKQATSYLGELKNAGNDVTQVIHGLTVELAANKQALDENALAIQKVKDQYDPIIKNDETKIAAINVLSPEELARKSDELNLDKAKANLELTKPDTSTYDARILSDQTTLDNMPTLDTSVYDTAISGYQAQIQSLQDSISGLNTDEFDRKINAIKDKLAEPAPDTQGITNQLKDLEEQLAGGAISQSQFDQQYGALSKQKQGINQAYTDQTTGLSGQLKLLEQQRADQALANQETARADRASIDSLKDKLSLEEAGRKKAVSDDAAARKKLTDDIKTEGNLRAQALAPYDAAMKKITDAQAVNSAKDAAAAAQRALDLAPYQRELDVTKQKESDALAPLLLKKQTLDENATKLGEEKTYWGQIGTGIKNATTALGEYLKLGSGGGTGSGGASSSAGGGGPGTVGYGAGILTNGFSPYDDPQAKDVPDSPIVTQLKTLKQWLIDNAPDIQKNVHTILDAVTNSVKYDLRAMFDGIDFVKSLAQLMSDFYNHHWEKIPGDLSALGNATLAGSSGGGGGAINELQGAFGSGTGAGSPTASGPLAQLAPTVDTPVNNAVANASGPVLRDVAGAVAYAPIVGAEAIKGFIQSIFGLGKSATGGQAVSASDMEGQVGEIDDFVQHIQDQLGDNGGAQQAIQSFKDQIVKEMGDGSDAATAVQDAEKTFTDKFGDGGSVPAALTQTGDATKSALGDDGTVPTILQLLRDNHVPLTVAGLLKAFGQGGDAPTAITGTGDQATKTFGDGGTFDQATTNVASKVGSTFGAGGAMDGHLANVDSKVGSILGTGGSAQGDMTAFDTHTSGIFGGDGTIIGYFTSVVRWLGGDWQGLGTAIAKPFTDAQAPIQNWFTWLGGGINWLAEHFKLPSITPYGGGTSSGATGGGGPAGNGTLPGYAGGLNIGGATSGPMPGHWALTGEEGPEPIFVPAGASIVPNHMAKALGMLPGHADGLNLPGVFDALLSSKGGNLQGTAGAFSDTLAANLGAPTLPGVDGGGAALTDAVRGGVFDWLKGSGVNLGPLLGGRNAGGSGFNGMALADFLAYMAAFGGPVDNEGAFNDLIGVGRQHGIDPRWLMAVMQTETGYGNAAGRLAAVWNFGGMEMNPLADFDSGVAATDSGAHFAGYNNLHDFLENIAQWINDNGTSFVSYDGSGVDKNNAYRSLLAAIPVIGGQAAGPFQSGGFPAVLGNAQGDIGQMFHDNHAWNLWCEQFAEYAGEQSGYPHLGWPTALAHADGVALNSGIGPPGSTMLWGGGYYIDGHAAISTGDGSVIGTSPQGIQRYDMGGAPDYRGWAPPGLAEGGAFSIPTTVTVGDGGEREFVLPESDLRAIVRSESRGGPPTFVFQPGAIAVDKNGNVTVNPAKVDILGAWHASGHL